MELVSSLLLIITLCCSQTPLLSVISNIIHKCDSSLFRTHVPSHATPVEFVTKQMRGQGMLQYIVLKE
jgi:hypothetical protein